MTTITRSSSRRRSRRGTASVEVVMMLPFFLIVYAGLYWMYGHYMGRQQAMLRARSCTWAFAATGCANKTDYTACLNDDPGKRPVPAPPDGSAPPPGPDPYAVSDQPVIESGASPDGAGGYKLNEVGDSKVGGVLSKIEKIPFLGDAVHYLFGKPVQGTSKQTVRFKQVRIAESEVRVAGSYSTLCNSVAESWEQVALDIFCSFLNNDFPGCG